jgi:hypothetical protein
MRGFHGAPGFVRAWRSPTSSNAISPGFRAARSPAAIASSRARSWDRSIIHRNDAERNTSGTEGASGVEQRQPGEARAPVLKLAAPERAVEQRLLVRLSTVRCEESIDASLFLARDLQCQHHRCTRRCQAAGERDGKSRYGLESVKLTEQYDRHARDRAEIRYFGSAVRRRRGWGTVRRRRSRHYSDENERDQVPNMKDHDVNLGGLSPVACALRPLACGLWPVACGLWPVACGLWPLA